MTIEGIIIAATVFLPQTSDEQMRLAPLAHGEAAFVDDGGIASLWVGDGKTSVPVTDRFTLRGTEERFVPADRVMVMFDGWTANGGSYEKRFAAGESASLRVCYGSDYTRCDVLFDEWSYKDGAAGSLVYNKTATAGDHDTLFTFAVDPGNSGTLRISNVRVRYFIGGVAKTNDLEHMKFKMKDRLGAYDLYDLRFWAKHLYDGNRGADWSAYSAMHNAEMGNHATVYGDFAIVADRVETNALTVVAGGRRAATVRFEGTEGDWPTNAMEIVRFQPGSQMTDGAVDTIALKLNGSIVDSFDIAKLRLEYSPDIYAKDVLFFEVDYSVVSQSVNEVVVTVPTKEDHAYYRFGYSDCTLVFEVHGTLRALGGIDFGTNRSLSDFGITNSVGGGGSYVPSSTDPVFSNAVLSVGLGIDTNSVAVLNEIAATFGGFPIEGTATTVGVLLTALAAAIAWLRKHKVDKLKVTGMTAEATAENGVAKLDDFFSESNSLLTGTIEAKLGPVNDALDAINGEVA